MSLINSIKCKIKDFFKLKLKLKFQLEIEKEIKTKLIPVVYLGCIKKSRMKK